MKTKESLPKDILEQLVNGNDYKEINLLTIISEGCRKYPAYIAHIKATGRCKECVVVLNARKELNVLEDS
jgi:hypothetical protein